MEANHRSGEVKADTRATRCPHCAGPLTKEMKTSKWTIPPLIRDSFSMIGSAVGGTAGAFYGFNHAMPIVRRWSKGPMWLHFLIGSTRHYFLVRMCWVSRWFHSSTSSTCILVVSCRCFIFTTSTVILIELKITEFGSFFFFLCEYFMEREKGKDFGMGKIANRNTSIVCLIRMLTLWVHM